MSSVRTYGRGEHPRLVQPGDLVFVHRRTVLSGAIKAMQRARFRGEDAPFAHWTHIAVVLSDDDDPELAEALGHGVERTRLSRYLHVQYRLVDIEQDPRDRQQMRNFLLACVAQPYDYWQLPSMVLQLGLGRRMAFAVAGTKICSVLAAEAQTRGSTIFPFEPWCCAPADLARFYRVRRPVSVSASETRRRP